MKLGLYLNTQWAPKDPVSVADTVAMTHAARDNGFEAVWLPNHYLVAPMQMLQPFTLLGRLVPESGKMLLGTNILISPLLNPTFVAEEMATLDVMSEGRAVLGVGIGVRQEEFTAFDVPMKARVGRMVEGMDLMRRLWTEDVISFKGDHFTVENAGISLKPRQPGGPKIFMGAAADVGIRRAAALSAGWLIGSGHTCAKVKEQLATYRTAWRDAGRTGEANAILTRECYVGSSQKTALEECRPALQAKFEAYLSWWGEGSAKEIGWTPEAFGDFARDRFIVGDRVFVKEELARYQEELGLNQLMARTQWIGLPIAASLRTIDALGTMLA